MIFERTTEPELVRGILTHPRVYPSIGDDFSPAVEDFKVNQDPRIWYVSCNIARTIPFGLFMFFPESPVCWEVHVAMLPEAWGELASAAGKRILGWIWNQDATVQRIVARVPRSNSRAVAFGLRSMGLAEYGLNPNSFLKRGRLWDQVLMGISRS